MPQTPPEKQTSPVGGKVSSESVRNAGAEAMRIADAAAQLSAEDLAQLRQYIDRHHQKLFQ
ncbi:MAG TPA: hypothetical protein VN645_16585 [Steroidobacteraceae bacterium]|nr:hypothetical protein [Steroidobacteraceae bacterium]